MTRSEGRYRRGALPVTVQLEPRLAQGRAASEAFVREAFALAYGALLHQFMPLLMNLRDDAGQLLAVLGLRLPGSEPLFLEQYLERPVEQQLAAATTVPVERATLVEVGNFAVGAAGGGRWLITALTAYLHAAGSQWAVFTCGPELRNAFHRLGVELVDIAPADPLRLDPAERADWGSYYAQRPRVMAANVAQSYRTLAALFDRECALNALWRHALQAGTMAA